MCWVRQHRLQLLSKVQFWHRLVRMAGLPSSLQMLWHFCRVTALLHNHDNVVSRAVTIAAMLSTRPSFYQALPDAVRETRDNSIPFLPRTEITCSRCSGHLGHVFNDGPPPTGLR